MCIREGAGGGLQGRAGPVRGLQRGQGLGDEGPGFRRQEFFGRRIQVARTVRKQKFRTLNKFEQSLGTLFHRRHGGEQARARGVGQNARRGFAGEKRDDFGDQGFIGCGADVMAVEIVEFFEIHPRGAFADMVQIEPFDGLGGGDDFLIAMAPAQPDEIIAHGLGQVAHVAIGLDGQRAVTLGKLGAVWAMDQRQMPIDGLRPAHGLDDLKLAGGIVQMIGAANNMGDAHVEIIHHHGQHISGRAVAAEQDHVVELVIGVAHIAQHFVVNDGLAILAGFQAHDIGRTRRIAAAAAASVVTHGLAGGLLCLAHQGQFLRGAIAAIGVAGGEQLLGHFAMPLGAGELINGLAVPVQTHPFHAVQDGGDGLGRRAFAVGIFDAQKELAAGMAGIQPVEQGRAGPADMQKAGGRGGKAQNRFFGFGHNFFVFGADSPGFGNASSKRNRVGVGPQIAVQPGAWPRPDFGVVRVLVDTALAERARWALWLPVALGVGIGAYFQLYNEPPGWTIWAALAACAVFAMAAILIRYPLALAVFALLAAMALGFGVAKLRSDAVAAPHLTRNLGPVRMEGRVVSAELRGTGMRAVIAVTSLPHVAAKDWPAQVRVTFRKPSDVLAPGRLVGATAMLMPPPSPAAPGDYDFGRWAFFQRIGAVGYAYGGPRALDAAPVPGILDRADARLEQLRANMTARIRAVIPGSTGGIAAAMITGDRGGIDDADTTAFRDSGLAHVLSISGLHLALAGGFFFWMVRAVLACFPRIALNYPIKKWAAVAALSGAGFYLAISGGGPAAFRSYVMIALMFLAMLFDRPALSMRAVALAALLLLLIWPESLLDPGFQMSFAAVTGLVAFGEWETGRKMLLPGQKRTLFGWIKRHVGGVIVASLIAGLATAPFAIFHFDRSSQFGVLANLAALPVVGLVVMPAATAAMVLMPFGLEKWPLIAMGKGIDLMLAIAHWVASLPGAASVTAVWPLTALLLAVAGGLWLALWQRRWRWFGLAPIAAAILLAQTATRPDMLVGEDGLTVAVRLANGKLGFLRPPADEYSASTWLLRDGDARLTADAVGKREEGVACDAYGCVAKTRAGPRVALASRIEALPEDCTQADILITAMAVRIPCTRPQLVIGHFDLARDGARAIKLSPTLQVTSVEEMRGQRPWNVR